MMKLHIFDADGTMLDSMKMWDKIAITYLESIDIIPEPNLPELIDPMPVSEAMDYIAEHYNIDGGSDRVTEGIDEILTEEYEHNILAFDDIFHELNELKEKNSKMIVFSNTPHKYLDSALERTGILDYFEKVYTVEDIGIRKDLPEAFKKVCDLYGVLPEEALVYEDSDFAINAAKNAGCNVKVYNRYR